MGRTYRIIWPRVADLTAAQVIQLAQDDCANGLGTDAQGFAMLNNPTVETAIEVLMDSGTVTFHKSIRE